jgi:hypothetical protein
VIGDIPWVSQAAEAFLSKIFACSYSIAGVNVLSGNPADHLVHRHTHRIVRGTLMVCGRPDGRLSALTSLESSVCLSVSQASSIQSLGGTCETINIGHNPFKLPLAAHTITLEQHRPKFLCETMLDWIYEENHPDDEIIKQDAGNQNNNGNANVISNNAAASNATSFESSLRSQDQRFKYTLPAPHDSGATDNASPFYTAVVQGMTRNKRHPKTNLPLVSLRKKKTKVVRHGKTKKTRSATQTSKHQSGVSVDSRSNRTLTKALSRAYSNDHDGSESDERSQTSTSQIMGTYSDLRQHNLCRSYNGPGQDPSHPDLDFQTESRQYTTLDSVIDDMIDHTTELLKLRKIFDEIDTSKCTVRENHAVFFPFGAPPMQKVVRQLNADSSLHAWLCAVRLG